MPEYANGGWSGWSIKEACVCPSRGRRLRLNDVSRKKLYYWVAYEKKSRPCDSTYNLRSRWKIGYWRASVPDKSKEKKKRGKRESSVPLTNLVTMYCYNTWQMRLLFIIDSDINSSVMLGNWLTLEGLLHSQILLQFCSWEKIFPLAFGSYHCPFYSWHLSTVHWVQDHLPPSSSSCHGIFNDKGNWGTWVRLCL